MVKINRKDVESVELRLKVSRDDAVLLLALVGITNGNSQFVSEVYDELANEPELVADAAEARKYLFEQFRKGSGNTLDWNAYQRSQK